MPTLTNICGFEFGLGSLSGSGLAVAVQGPFPTFPAGRTGGLCAQCAAASANRSTWQRTHGNARIVQRFYFRLTVAPSVDRPIWFGPVGAGGRPDILYRASDGHLIYGFVGGTYQDLGAISTNTWYRIDLDINVSPNPRTFDCQLDGAPGTQATLSVAGGTTVVEWGVGADDLGASAITTQFDDISTSVTAADYPLGPGKVIKILPGSDGTHSFTANDFSTGDAGTQRAPSYTDFWLMVDEPGAWVTARSTTDNIAQRVIRTAGYVEIAPAATPESDDANGVMAYLAYSGGTATTNSGKCEVRNSAGAAAELWGIFPSTTRDYSETTNFFKSVMVTKPGAGWTPSEVDAIRWRLGGSGDISPVPTWQMLMLEADYPEIVPITYEETGSLATGSSLSGADVREAAELGAVAAGTKVAGTDTAEHSETGFVVSAGKLSGVSLKDNAGKAGAIAAGGKIAGADVTTYAEAGSLTAKGLLAGADVVQYAEAGSLITRAIIVGADAVAFAETGFVKAGTVLAGLPVFIASVTGSVMTRALSSGVSQKEAAGKLGSITAGGLISGADMHESVETGSLRAGSSLSGLSAEERQKLGALTFKGLLAGVDAPAYAEAGTLAAGGRLSGADASTYSEAGSVTTKALASGGSIKEGAGKSGSITTTGRIAGADASEFSESGAIVSTGRITGADVAQYAEFGALSAGTRLTGADSYQPSESGSVVAGTRLSGVWALSSGRSGFLAAGARLSGFKTLLSPKPPGTEVFLVNADGSDGGLLGTGSGGSLIGRSSGGELHKAKG